MLLFVMSTVDVEHVRDSLKKCMDPEVPLSIVDMGLIYGINVTENNDVNIKMTMTTKGCPLHETMVDDVKRYTKKVSGVNNVDVEIVWDPPWTMDKMSDTAKALMKTMGSQNTPAPINYETAVPQGVGNLVKQEDGSLVLANEHEQGFMVNQAIIDFWKSCNGQRKVTELVELFAQQTGLQRAQVEKEVMQLLKQLHEGGLLLIPNQNDVPNVEFKKLS
jgi:metal-sulfur cluster biosynthetic enzyme|tara:strand:- start:306 stop:962 length:657 start_codon:yes stop_codon:yes gene_type:complete